MTRSHPTSTHTTSTRSTSTRRSLLAAVAATVVLGACTRSPIADTAAAPADAEPSALAPATTTSPTTTVAPTTAPATTTPVTSAPTTIAPTTTEPATTAPTTIAPATSEPVAVVPAAGADVELPSGFSVTIPVDVEGGLSYTAELVNELRFGVDQISVDDRGGVHVSDPLADRILSIRGDEWAFLDLAPLGITYAMDMIAGDDHLVILDDGRGEHRVVAVSYDGELLDEAPVPAGFRLEDGLQGLIDTGDDERWVIWSLAEGGDAYLEFDRSARQWVPGEPLAAGGHAITHTDGAMTVDGTVVPLDATPANEWWAVLRLLGTGSDGTLVFERWDGISTIEWWTPSGTFVGSVLAPRDQVIEEALLEVVVDDDGRAYALVTGPDSVTVAELVPSPQRLVAP